MSRSTNDHSWTDADLADPHAAPDKAARVRAMFTAIAPTYDLNNRLHSLWRDQAWRRAAVRMANVQPGDVVVDVACGTGDLAMAFTLAGAHRVMGLDFTPEMLRLAAEKNRNRLAGAAQQPVTMHKPATRDASRHPLNGMPHYGAGDAMRLPLADACCDVVSIAFGLRNVAEPSRAMAEFYRVLKPGGRVIVLEFSEPTNPMIRAGYHVYSKHVMPRTASWIARDRTGAYRYLPRSVDTFVDRGGMTRLMEEAGFAQVTLKPLTLGVAVCYRGVKGS